MITRATYELIIQLLILFYNPSLPPPQVSFYNDTKGCQWVIWSMPEAPPGPWGPGIYPSRILVWGDCTNTIYKFHGPWPHSPEKLINKFVYGTPQ